MKFATVAGRKFICVIFNNCPDLRKQVVKSSKRSGRQNLRNQIIYQTKINITNEDKNAFLRFKRSTRVSSSKFSNALKHRHNKKYWK